MSLKDAKTLVSRTDKDPELREAVRKAYPDKLTAVAKDQGLSFTKDEFHQVLRERAEKRRPAKKAAGKKGAAKKGAGKKSPGKKGGGGDKPDICYCI